MTGTKKGTKKGKGKGNVRCLRANVLWVAEFEDGHRTERERIWTLCYLLAQNPERKVVKLEAFWRERAAFAVVVPHDNIPLCNPPDPSFVEGHIVCWDAETLLMRRLMEMEIPGATPVVLRPDPEPVIRARAARALLPKVDA